ncbi:hypothetical protein U9M48_022855, partial [Paspalum notatum var. saurae]
DRNTRLPVASPPPSSPLLLPSQLSPPPRLLPEFEIPERASHGLLRSVPLPTHRALARNPGRNPARPSSIRRAPRSRASQICEIRTDTAAPTPRWMLP